MSTTISSTYSLGFAFTTAGQNPITVTSTGTVSTSGKYALYGNKAATWTFTNAGYLSAAKYGIQTNKGGSVTNASGGTIRGGSAGVQIGVGTGSVVNDGTIGGVGTVGGVAVTTSIGVQLKDGGGVLNGASSHTALIEGYTDGVSFTVKAASLTNSGTVEATGTAGIGALISKGGNLTNGAGNAAALISGVTYGASIVGVSNVLNTGTIIASVGTAVLRTGSGSFVNGSTSATNALMEGGKDGVVLVASPASASQVLTNFGTIIGESTYGVRISGGGGVTNGSATVTTADIYGGIDGVTMNTKGSVTNYGTIGGGKYAITLASVAGNVINKGSIGSAGVGIQRIGSGTISNASGATITGGSRAVALVFSGSPTLANAVVNLGFIGGGTAGIGVSLAGGGTVTNGAANDLTATITGGLYGVQTTGTVATVVNFGSITGTGPVTPGTSLPFPPMHTGHYGGYGVDLHSGGVLTNGSNADTSAYIYGALLGVQGHGANTTMHNYGTVAGGICGIYNWLGGLLTNGSALDTKALISGAQKGFRNTGPGQTIHNYGTFFSSQGSGLNLTSGGSTLAAAGLATNGSATDTIATMSGYLYGFTSVFGGTLQNFGSVIGFGTTGVGAAVTSGGTLINGSVADTSALITGGAVGALTSGTYTHNGHATVNSIINDGTIAASGIGAGVYTGGVLVNGAANVTGALIDGGSGAGVFGHGGAATVINDGTIESGSSYGVTLSNASQVTNGATNVTHALITGTSGVIDSGGLTTVVNYGTLIGTSMAGVYLNASGTVSNGGATVKGALISGVQFGAYLDGSAGALGTVTNWGAITASGSSSTGVYLGSGGRVTNGATGDTTALIAGGSIGIGLVRGGTVANYASITGSSGTGVSVVSGGVVTNGAATDTAARIYGGMSGVVLGGGTVTNSLINDGTIIGAGAMGVYMGQGGKVVNGASLLTAARISGTSFGLKASGNPLTLVNDGTIVASTGMGVYSRNAGTFTNGEAGVTAALISGVSYGLESTSSTAATLTNNGTITASGGTGVYFIAGGVLTNGATGNTKALIHGSADGVNEQGPSTTTRTLTNFGTISGATGVFFSSQALATVVNAGTIIGTGGTALQFGVGADTLILDPGAVFQGEVDGGVAGINVVTLASGSTTGSIGGFGQTSGNGIENFATLSVASTAKWSLTGNDSIQSLTNNGTLQIANAGSLDVSLAVDSHGTGTFQIEDNATLDVAVMTGASSPIQFLGADSSRLNVDLATSFGLHIGGTTYTGPLLQDFGSAGSVDLLSVASLGAILNFDSSSGLLQITNSANAKLGTLSFDTATLGGGSFHAGDDGSGHLLISHS